MSKRKLVTTFEENSSESLEVLKDILFIAEVASGPMFRKMIVLHMAIQKFIFKVKIQPKITFRRPKILHGVHFTTLASLFTN